MRFPTITLRLAVFACLFVLGWQPLAAQRKRNEPELAPAPPPAMDRNVTVAPGATVEIPLGIYGARAGQVEFLIRTPPRNGKLSAVQVTGANSARVQYQASKEGGNDRFTYAVRTEEGVSVPAVVNITVVLAPALPARLVAVDALDFPAVMVGKESTATLEVINKGGGVAEGELTVPRGWRVDGSAKYALASGKNAIFKLVFAPEKAGPHQGSAIFGPDPRRAVTLHGLGTPVWQVSAAKLELAAAPGSSARGGSLRIENFSDEPRTVRVTGGARLIVEKQVSVPAAGAAELKVAIDPQDPMRLDDKLELEAADWKTEIIVEAAALPARVKIGGAAPDFGKVEAGREAEVFVTLENSGGLPAIVSVQVDAPFEVAAAGVQVPARGEVKVPVYLRASKAGSYHAVFAVLTDGHKEQLPLAAEVIENPSRVPLSMPPLSTGEGSVQRPDVIPKPRDKTMAIPAPEFPSELVFPSVIGDVPAGMGHYTREITPKSVVLEWPASLGPANALSVQERQLSPGPADVPVVTWVPLPSCSISESGGLRRAEIQDLEPGRLYVVRVASEGNSIFATKFVTPRKKPFFNVSWRRAAITLLVAGVAGFGWWRWKNRARTAW